MEFFKTNYNSLHIIYFVCFKVLRLFRPCLFFYSTLLSVFSSSKTIFFTTWLGRMEKLKRSREKQQQHITIPKMLLNEIVSYAVFSAYLSLQSIEPTNNNNSNENTINEIFHGTCMRTHYRLSHPSLINPIHPVTAIKTSWFSSSNLWESFKKNNLILI